MQNQDEVRDFLTSRRARVAPERVHLPAGPNRRVPGLRRSEVAMLAGVSVEYYARLERGHLSGASESVLDALAEALLLDDAERGHLFDLARTANASPVRAGRRKPAVNSIRPSVRFLLDAISGSPAVVRTARLDLVAENGLWRALYSPLYDAGDTVPNLARFAFLHRDRSERFFADWRAAADICVEVLRAEAGRDPHDRALQDLVGELSTRSEDFRRKWGAHDVRWHGTGLKGFHHPVVGDLELTYEELSLVSAPGLTLLTYSPAVGSPSADALRLLASWWATQGEATSERGSDAPARSGHQA